MPKAQGITLPSPVHCCMQYSTRLSLNSTCATNFESSFSCLSTDNLEEILIIDCSIELFLIKSNFKVHFKSQQTLLKVCVCGLAVAFRNLGQNLWGPHRYGSLSDVQVSSVVSGPCAAHSLLITTEGKLWSWGRNAIL